MLIFSLTKDNISHIEECFKKSEKAKPNGLAFSSFYVYYQMKA
nr:MAG TPA: hypothetical protein [Caudoviricetes sp.]